MSLGLKGRRALVTGGTKGIGRAIAECFAEESADVAPWACNLSFTTQPRIIGSMTPSMIAASVRVAPS